MRLGTSSSVMMDSEWFNQERFRVLERDFSMVSVIAGGGGVRRDTISMINGRNMKNLKGRVEIRDGAL